MYFNPQSNSKRIINTVSEHKNSLKRKSLFRKGKATPCSQCTFGMDSHMAEQQIANKRENAPICMSCILGKPRRNREQVRCKMDHIIKSRDGIKAGVSYPEEKRDGKIQRKKELDKLSDR